MEKRHIQHLYWRAGFGVSPKLLNTLKSKNKSKIINDLFNKSRMITPLTIDTSDFDNLKAEDFYMNAQVREKFIKISAEKGKELNANWVQKLIHSDQLIRERMTLFWSNHFVCKDKFLLHVLNYNNTLRKHALGHFGDFVKAISKEASMIKYLNTKQNLKKKPNENFARELMELFTLGIGNYSEQDIKEVARAFTGYSHTFRGDFQLRQKHHDYGNKTIFNKSGAFDGDDVIDIILQEKQCARFVCEKIYKYFVNTETINKSHIEDMVKVFYPDYNIETLMRFVFSSDWFYNEDHIGTKIKSPIELLVGILKVTPVTFKKRNEVLKIQRLLGQTLLNPPNVAGWKGGRHWIDSNTIMIRLKLPSVLLNGSKITTKKKGSPKDSLKQFTTNEKYKRKAFKTSPNWRHFNYNYSEVTLSELKNLLILGKVNKGTNEYLDTLDKYSKREYCIQLMSLPEYQMC